MNKVISYPAYPITQASINNKRKLVVAYKVKNIIIPKRYESDGLSLKFKLFRLIVSKYAPKFEPFFFLHDYLCDKEEYRLADNLGQEILFEIEKSLRTKLMIKAVKIYHKIKYKES